MTMKTAMVAIGILVSGAALAEMPGEHFIENWDLNEDGEVTAEEATERRSDIFAAFDGNEDGMLDAEEYVLFDQARAEDQKGRPGRRHGPARGMTLEANDVDGDGAVSEDEFIDLTADWIARIDRNGDGVVTLADFGPRS